MDKLKLILVIALLLAGGTALYYYEQNVNKDLKISTLTQDINERDELITSYKEQIAKHNVVISEYESTKVVLQLESEQRRLDYERLLKGSDCRFSVELTAMLYKQISDVRSRAMSANTPDIVRESGSALPVNGISCKNVVLYVETLLTIIDNQNIKFDSIRKLR